MNGLEVKNTIDELFDDGLKDTLYALYSNDGGEYQGPHPFKLLCASHGLTEAYTGCTKAVVAIDNRTIVKLPLLGDASAEFIDGDTEVYGKSAYGCDHCLVEEMTFGKAVEAGVSKFFNGLSTFYSRPGLTAYVCDKARHVARVPDLRRDALDGCVRSFFDKTNAEYGIAGMLVGYYGLDDVRDLCRFLDDNGIYDVCSDNWGYVGGMLKLIDYSDFVG